MYQRIFPIEHLQSITGEILSEAGNKQIVQFFAARDFCLILINKNAMP